MIPWEKVIAVSAAACGVGFLAVLAVYEFSKTAQAATTPANGPVPPPGANYVVTPLAVGQTFNLHMGDTLTFQLPAPALAGQTWEVIPSTAAWDEEGSGTSTNSTGVVVDTFVYTPTSTGSSTFTMALYGSSNYQIGVSYQITVNVT